MDIENIDVGNKRIINVEPSTRPIAGSPSIKLNGGVEYQPTSSYGHINLAALSNERNNQTSKISYYNENLKTEKDQQ
jgi:hypothetical protein